MAGHQNETKQKEAFKQLYCEPVVRMYSSTTTITQVHTKLCGLVWYSGKESKLQ